MKAFRFFVILACLGFLLFAGYENRAEIRSFFLGEVRQVVEISGLKISVRVADEPMERIQGLSGTEALGEFSGLLFVFDENDRHGIWMKDMNYPLDIIWLDESGRVVHIEERVSPDSYPRTFRPNSPARYVLEVNANVVDAFGIEVGQQATLPDGLTR